MLGKRDMIFASVGSMLPFDRLVRAVDEWSLANRAVDVFLQIGDGKYEPRHCDWARIVPHAEYQQRLKDCSLFVAHVGMASILQVVEIGKQMLLMPRHASLREHTTDHQLHTAKKFSGTQGLMIVDDVAALQSQMSKLLEAPMRGSDGISRYAPSGMTNEVRQFLSAGLR